MKKLLCTLAIVSAGCSFKVRDIDGTFLKRSENDVQVEVARIQAPGTAPTPVVAPAGFQAPTSTPAVTWVAYEPAPERGIEARRYLVQGGGEEPRLAHTQEAAGSNPAPATNMREAEPSRETIARGGAVADGRAVTGPGSAAGLWSSASTALLYCRNREPAEAYHVAGCRWVASDACCGLTLEVAAEGRRPCRTCRPLASGVRPQANEPQLR